MYIHMIYVDGNYTMMVSIVGLMIVALVQRHNLETYIRTTTLRRIRLVKNM